MILSIDQQVPTRSTCERMKELGFPQNGTFFVHERMGSHKRIEEFVVPRYQAGILHIVAAPTVSELLEVLEKQGWNVVELLVREGSYYAEVDDIARSWTATAPTAAEALALLWIKTQETKCQS